RICFSRRMKTGVIESVRMEWVRLLSFDLFPHQQDAPHGWRPREAPAALSRRAIVRAQVLPFVFASFGGHMGKGAPSMRIAQRTRRSKNVPKLVLIVAVLLLCASTVTAHARCKVLLVGGDTDIAISTSPPVTAELYDPPTETFTPTRGQPSIP